MEVPPEVQELIKESKYWSNESWVNISEDFYGIKIRNMTLNHLVLLDGIETPFIKGGSAVTETDIALFLWIVSEEYSDCEKAKRDFTKR